MSRVPVGITTGDHRGVGAEVVAKGLHKLRHKVSASSVVIFGLREVYAPYRKYLPPQKHWAHLTDEEFLATTRASLLRLIQKHLLFVEPAVPAQKMTVRDAYLCGRYIETAALGAQKRLLSAITTGPIDKNELRRGGYPFDGHTEMLQTLTGAPTVTMMLAGPKMRVSLATTHTPLREVASKLSEEKILVCIRNSVAGLRQCFGIKTPRLAVLGLNPHAGDDGLFGREEIEVIRPAIEKAMIEHKGRASIVGPFPPDGFFAQWRTRNAQKTDAIVCMYHDQGLIPAKLVDFENTVNISLGLPIVRTSVDHGVGYDIAGANKADPTSFCAALMLAKKVCSR